MDRNKIVDAIEEMVDKMLEAGGKPYAIICSRKTFEKLGLYFPTQSPIEKKFVFRKMRFVYSFGDLPVLKFKFCPEDKIHVVDKDTYDRLMWENKEGVFAATTHRKGEGNNIGN